MTVLERIVEVTADVLDRRITYILVEEANGLYAVVVVPKQGNWECTCDEGVERASEGFAANCEHARQAAAFVNPPSTDAPARFDAGMFVD